MTEHIKGMEFSVQETQPGCPGCDWISKVAHDPEGLESIIDKIAIMACPGASTKSAVCWCPCGTVYVLDGNRSKKAIPVYSF